MSDEFIPERIERRDDGVIIRWADEDPVRIPARPLRLACQCASCKDEMTGIPILDPETVPLDIGPMAVHLVGSYAIRIDWSDGHGSGIYPYEWLRQFAQRYGTSV